MFSNLLDITGFFVGVLINLLLIAMICYYFKRKIDNLEFSQSEQAKTLYTLIAQSRQSSSPVSNSGVNEVMENNIIKNLDLSKLNNNEDVEVDDSESDEESDEDTDEESEIDDKEEKVIEDAEEHDIIKTVKEFNNNGDSMVIETINIMAGIESVEPPEDVKQIDIQHELVENNSDDETNVVSYENKGLSEVVEELNGVTKLESDILENIPEDYEKMTVKELKSVLAQKGVHAKSSMNKSEIINVLKGFSVTEEVLEEST